MKSTRSFLSVVAFLFFLSGCGFPFSLGFLENHATPQARHSISAVQQGFLRVHYRRFDRRYSEWGLHFWGTATKQPTKWNSPAEFSMSDTYGRYVDLRVDNVGGSLSFLVHNGNARDVAIERRVDNLNNNREIWLKQEQDAVWLSEPSTEPEFVFAEFVSPNLIRGVASQEGSVSWKNVSVRDQFGNIVPNRTVDVNGANVYVTLNSRADFSKTYKLVLGEQEQWVRYSGAVLDSEFTYEGDDLGAVLRDDGTVRFKLWTPPATEVVVHMFDPANSSREIGKKPLVRGDFGVWSIDVAPYEVGLNSLDAVFYQYEVTALGQTRIGLDPYAKSMADFNPASVDVVGKAAILSPRRWSPRGFAEDSFENGAVMRSRADMVAYEIHVRDFTSDPSSGVEEPLRGTYAGFGKKIPYLKDLGVTHVQLLPVQNYYTVNEGDRAFRGADARNLNYNWGYDPHNYFTPEGWLSTNSTDPYRRVLELKDMVRQLHASGIGVIMDVVYNHTYNANVFENVCPGCYYRADDRGRISTFTGAGPSLESRRLMVRKLIVDSLKYFVDEYHVNGFRFDLMGFIDRGTMEKVRDILGPDVLPTAASAV
jgi:pullulanase